MRASLLRAWRRSGLCVEPLRDGHLPMPLRTQCEDPPHHGGLGLMNLAFHM